MALTAKQEAFAQHYALHRNGAEAYRHAYECAEDILAQTLSKRAGELLNDGDISGRINQLINEATASLPVTMTIAECFARWLMMADSDPDELTGLRIGSCRHCWGDGHGYHWKESEYLTAIAEWEKLNDPSNLIPDIGGGFGYRKTRAPNPDCPICEGEGVAYQRAVDTSKLSDKAKLIFGGVKPTRYGWEIILADRVKCLENASRIIGAFKDNVRLDGSLSAMVAAVTSDDPKEAAKLYMEMVAHAAAK